MEKCGLGTWALHAESSTLVFGPPIRERNKRRHPTEKGLEIYGISRGDKLIAMRPTATPGKKPYDENRGRDLVQEVHEDTWYARSHHPTSARPTVRNSVYEVYLPKCGTGE